MQIWNKHIFVLTSPHYFFLLSITLNKRKERWRKAKLFNSWHERVKMSRVSITCNVFLPYCNVFSLVLWKNIWLLTCSSSESQHTVRFTENKRGFPTVLWCILRFQGNLYSYQTKVKQTHLFQETVCSAFIFTKWRRWRELRGKWQISWILL